MQDRVPGAGGELVRRVPVLDAGAVEEDGDARDEGEDLGDEGGDGGLGREVAGYDVGLAAQGEDLVVRRAVGGVALFWGLEGVLEGGFGGSG